MYRIYNCLHCPIYCQYISVSYDLSTLEKGKKPAKDSKNPLATQKTKKSPKKKPKKEAIKSDLKQPVKEPVEVKPLAEGKPPAVEPKPIPEEPVVQPKVEPETKEDVKAVELSNPDEKTLVNVSFYISLLVTGKFACF